MLISILVSIVVFGIMMLLFRPWQQYRLGNRKISKPAHNNESDAILQRYNELLFAVGQKYPNETRHQTALRYIQQAEQFDNGGVVKQAHVS